TAKTQTTQINVVKLDEAFIDFWSDAYADIAMTSNWPTFVLCQLKANAPVTAATPEGRPITWLIIEHAFTYPPPPPPPPVSEPTSPTSPTAPKRASSPRPSIQSNLSSRKSSTFSARTRFNFFGTSSNGEKQTAPSSGTSKTGFSLKNPSSRKRGAKAPRVGEMGEVLAEVEESPKAPESENALGLAGADVTKKAEELALTPEASVSSETPSQDVPTPVAEPKTVLATVHEDEQKEETTSAEGAAVSQSDVTVPTEPSVKADEQAVPGPTETDHATAPGVETIVPSAESTPPGLSPVPVVDTVPVPAPEAPAPVAVEPVVLDEDRQDRPAVVHPEAAPGLPQADSSEVTITDDAEVLPPAPEPIVLSGGTPGPAVALSTSEPAALAEAAVSQAQDGHSVEPAQEAILESSTARVPADEPIEVVSNAVKQEMPETSPLPESSVTDAVVDQVEVPPPTTSTPTAPEIPVEAPMAIEETVKGEDLAVAEAAESEHISDPAPDPVAVLAPEESVEEQHDASADILDPTQGQSVVAAEDDAPAVASLDSEPVVDEKPTLSENVEPIQVAVVDEAIPSEDAATELSPRADAADRAPLSESAEANLERAAVSSPTKDDHAPVAPVVLEESAAPVEAGSHGQDEAPAPEPTGEEADEEVAADTTAAENEPALIAEADHAAVAEQREPIIEDVAPPPTTEDPETSSATDPAEVTPGAKLSSDRSEDTDTPAAQSIDAAPEEVDHSAPAVIASVEDAKNSSADEDAEAAPPVPEPAADKKEEEGEP
ncbi:hypothetical protein EIP91_010055, partial [Steccherinum ochraceum]